LAIVQQLPEELVEAEEKQRKNRDRPRFLVLPGPGIPCSPGKTGKTREKRGLSRFSLVPVFPCGTTMDRILEWATQMHGYLSSPKGGGVRHGTDLKDGISLSLSESRLFCNLTRSYITFLLNEHESMS
jgi:hypothetical protein